MEKNPDLRRMFDLTDKVSVVTGSSGMLGSEIALALASFGSNVVVAGRKTEKLKSLGKKIEAMGRKTLEIKVEVTLEKDLVNLAAATVEKFGKVDILVACAGSNTLKPALEYPAEDFEKLMRINALGTFLTDREIGRKMIEQGHGKIVNISSIRGFFATSANTVAYSASKSAVNMITKQLACEWARYKINVNAVAPAMVAGGMHTSTPTGEIPSLDPKVLQGITKRTPLKRLAQPEDIVGAVIFLASDASNFVTGQVILVDGGASAWAA